MENLVMLTERLSMEQGQGQGEQSGQGSGAQQQPQTPLQQSKQQLKIEAAALAARILMALRQIHLRAWSEESGLRPEEIYREHEARACTICGVKSVRVVEDELGWKMVVEIGELRRLGEFPEFRLVKDGERWKAVRVPR